VSKELHRDARMHVGSPIDSALYPLVPTSRLVPECRGLQDPLQATMLKQAAEGDTG